MIRAMTLSLPANMRNLNDAIVYKFSDFDTFLSAQMPQYKKKSCIYHWLRQPGTCNSLYFLHSASYDEYNGLFPEGDDWLVKFSTEPVYALWRRRKRTSPLFAPGVARTLVKKGKGPPGRRFQRPGVARMAAYGQRIAPGFPFTHNDR